MPSWHEGHFKSIKVPSGKKPIDLVEGDKLEVSLTHGMNFSPVILVSLYSNTTAHSSKYRLRCFQENSATKFRWRGSLPGVFTGDHVFEFHPSESTPGGTKFIQYEDFSGLLSFTMKPEKKSGQMNLEGFKQLNEDLKKKVESGV